MYPRSRKRKLTDKTLPNALFQSPEFSEDSKMYRDLLDMERRLDWTISRKRVEVQDAVARIIPVRHLNLSPQKRAIQSDVPLIDFHGRRLQTTRTLRIFLSHTVSGQLWQRNAENVSAEGEAAKVNAETGEGIPAWSFRMDGRLLEVRHSSNNLAYDEVYSCSMQRFQINVRRIGHPHESSRP